MTKVPSVRRENAYLAEITNCVLCFCQALLRSLLRPQIGFGIGLRKDSGRSNQVPCSESEACIAMILLRGDILHEGKVIFRFEQTNYISGRDIRSNGLIVLGPAGIPSSRTRSIHQDDRR